MRRLQNICSIPLLAWMSATASYEINVHDLMSREAYLASQVHLDTKILSELELSESSTFKNSSGEGPLSIERLIRDGSRFEDTLGFPPRVLNHFFDPVSGNGLNPFPSNYSSPDWALEDGAQISGPIWMQRFSYRDARTLLYNALTSPLGGDRAMSFGLMFQALGHVMHHLQDMAQPQHVRNDQHIEL